MKKICHWFMIFALLLCGCNSTGRVEETIYQEMLGDEMKKMMLIYPNFNIEVLDEQLNAYVEQLKAEFSNQDEAELNMSYRLKEFETFYSLAVFVDSNEREEVATYAFDKQGKRFYEFEDLFDEERIKELSQIIKTELEVQDDDANQSLTYRIGLLAKVENFRKFFFDKDGVFFYFDGGQCFDDLKVHKVKLPYEKIESFLKVDLSIPVLETYDELLYQSSKPIDPNKPMVALTFDDGPNRYTDDLLDALLEHRASATFFVLGSMVERFPKTIQRMVLEGNEIGNHTMNHRQLSKCTASQINEEILQAQTMIESITHIPPSLLRPPYGEKNDMILEAWKDDVVLWDIDTRDWASKDVKKIIDITLEEVRDGAIILMHDIYPTSVQAAIELIPLLQEQGYQLVTVSQLKEYRSSLHSVLSQ